MDVGRGHIRGGTSEIWVGHPICERIVVDCLQQTTQHTSNSAMRSSAIRSMHRVAGG